MRLVPGKTLRFNRAPDDTRVPDGWHVVYQCPRCHRYFDSPSVCSDGAEAIPRLERKPRLARRDWSAGTDVASGGDGVSVADQTRTKITHGRHCICTPCSVEDWTNPALAPCGMHGLESVKPEVDQLVRRLFAAWQEQTAGSDDLARALAAADEARLDAEDRAAYWRHLAGVAERHAQEQTAAKEWDTIHNLQKAYAEGAAEERERLAAKAGEPPEENDNPHWHLSPIRRGEWTIEQEIATTIAHADRLMSIPDLAATIAARVVPLIEQRVIDRLARETDGRVQRLQDAIHAADRELITIADFSIQEAADAIDSVRAGLKDALAETDVPAPDDARSVPDQFPAIDGIIDRLAAEAGSKRARTSQLHRIVTLDVAIEAVREGAAAGVAASEARVRELETVARDLAALISHEDDGIGREWYELTAGWRETERALSALAALLSEEAS